MDDWQAYQFHRDHIRIALALLLFGTAAVFIGALAGGDTGMVVAYYGSAFGLEGLLFALAYAYDGRTRQAMDWLYRRFGDEDYPWSAHDVEVTYRDG